MRHSNIIAAGPERDRALEMMEQVLAIMVAHHDDEGAVALQAIMERTMGTHADPEQDGEIWDMIETLPHFTERVLYLHRLNGLTISQIARRLGLNRKEVAERLSLDLQLVRGAP